MVSSEEKAKTPVIHYVEDGGRAALNFVASTCRVRNNAIIHEPFNVQAMLAAEASLQVAPVRAVSTTNLMKKSGLIARFRSNSLDMIGFTAFTQINWV